MKPITRDTVLKWLSGTLTTPGTDHMIDHVTVDSRKVRNGSLFIPLKGVRWDGHEFLREVADKGAAAALVQEGAFVPEDLPPSMALIQIKDSLEALKQLAGNYRNQFRIPVIAVTGSNGKTTTKDMVASVLSVKYNILKNQGNLNNHIGLPLTLLEMDDSHEAAVIEMGMSGLGEIRELSLLAKPDIAFITNIGWAHVEKLGSREMIANAKMEIIDGLKDGGLLVINGDDAFLPDRIQALTNEFSVDQIGFTDGNDLQALHVTDLAGKGVKFRTNLTGAFSFKILHPGIHHTYSALFAVWTGKHFNLTDEEIQQGLDKFRSSGMRMEICRINNCVFINDAYNANPDSMKVALQFLGSYPALRRFAVLGNMYELGTYAEDGHRKMALDLIDGKVDMLITVGDLAAWIAEEAETRGLNVSNIMRAENLDQAAAYLKQLTKPGDVILIKGSRAMEMEKLFELMEEGDI